jgi:hypothetical protein
MNKIHTKRGFTISVVSATVVIMIILISTISVVGIATVNSANFEEYMSLLYRVKAATYDFIMFNKVLPTTGEVVTSSEFDNDFITELTRNGDLDAKFYVLDIPRLNVVSSQGKGTIENEDVFIVSSVTNNVYYLKGKRYKGITYYGVNN